MKKLFAIITLAGALFMGVTSPLSVVPKLTEGVRPTSDFALMLALNGVPVKIGVLTSTGTSVNQGTTGTTFTLTGGTVIEVVCDGAAFINIGATSSSDYTNANFGRPMTTGVSRWFVLRDTDTDISLDTSGGTVNCHVAAMR